MKGGVSADGDATYGGSTSFYDTSTATNATFINNGSSASGTIFGGFTNLLYYSSAESATFINNPGTIAGAAAGHTLIQTFQLGSWGKIGDSTFTANPATVPGAEGGWVEIDVGTSAGASFVANGSTVADCQAGQIYVYGGDGYATFSGKGGRGTNAQGGLIDLFGLPNSDQTVVKALGGISGGLGGTILVEGTPVLDLGQFQLFGNGTLDLINATGLIVIGSLSGSGIVSLDSHTLSVGNNNLNTTFSGEIQGSGGLTKAGSGTFTLTGANTYTGSTSERAGVLIVNNRTGSATGAGNVTINGGTLGGKGIIAGAGTIGMGTGSGAFLAPSVGSNQPVTLTLRKTLTLKADSTYTCKLNTNNARADQVIAKGVTIESGAQFSLSTVANKKLARGTVFTVMSNIASAPISGAFVNLPEGSTFTAGRNNFQVSYEGGDGNDLTLTVVP